MANGVAASTINPAAFKDIGVALQMFEKHIVSSLECMVAVKVVEYDYATHTAMVQPLVDMAIYNGDNTDYVERNKFECTVLRFCHGGFVLDAPVDVGDTGWVIAADRDTTLVKQSNDQIAGADNKGHQRPNTFSKHQYTFGFFIPDNWARINDDKFKDKFVIGDIDKTDGTLSYITFDKDGNLEIVSDKFGMTIGGQRLTLRQITYLSGFKDNYLLCKKRWILSTEEEANGKYMLKISSGGSIEVEYFDKDESST